MSNTAITWHVTYTGDGVLSVRDGNGNEVPCSLQGDMLTVYIVCPGRQKPNKPHAHRRKVSTRRLAVYRKKQRAKGAVSYAVMKSLINDLLEYAKWSWSVGPDHTIELQSYGETPR